MLRRRLLEQEEMVEQFRLNYFVAKAAYEALKAEFEGA
jgi:hypothetical protein